VKTDGGAMTRIIIRPKRKAGDTDEAVDLKVSRAASSPVAKAGVAAEHDALDAQLLLYLLGFDLSWMNGKRS